MLRLIFSLFLLTSPLYAADSLLMQLHSEQDISEIHPQHDSLAIRLQINRANGDPVHAARLHVRLQSPDTPWIASTDFPIVEGSRLFDSEIEIDDGVFNFAFVPPIRGTYTLQVDVSPQPGDDSFAPTHQQWPLVITENPSKQRNLGLLLFILISVGSIGGFIAARSVFSGKKAVAALSLAWFMLAAVPTERLDAHDHGEVQRTSSPPVETDALSGRLELTLLTAQPRVGELATLRARLLDANGTPRPSRFRLTFRQLEHDIEVFRTETIATNGVMEWNGQFYDGSDHRVVVEAVPIAESFNQDQVSRTEQLITVEAIAPPPRAVVKSFGFLMLITAFAMGLGIMLGWVPKKHKDFSF